MQRYFVASEQMNGSSVTLQGEDAHHAAKVMRMRPEERFIVCDGQGKSALAEVVQAAPSLVEARIVEWLDSDSEPIWHISIAQSLPKGDKMELVIQKCTEIGAYSFMPFESERMIVQYDNKKEAKRIERWSKIAKEAAEQSHRNHVPSIEGVHSWRELLLAVPAFDLALFCYEREGDAAHGRGIRTALKEWQARREHSEAGASPRLLLIVGSEGGFTEREADEAEAAGAVLVGLGRRILRTETAGIVGLTCLLYEAGEMGGA